MSSTNSQSKLVKKPIRSIAAYRRSDGTFDFVPLTGKVDPKRDLAFEIAVAQPAYKFGVQIGANVIPLGLQWPNEPARDWQTLADKVAAEDYAEREREAQREKARKAAERARKTLLSAIAREDASFDFATEFDTSFCSPNKRVGLKALSQGGKFLDAVRDGDGTVWYKFADTDGVLRETICPSCGGENIIESPDHGLVYKVCRSTTACEFRWLKEFPKECPSCHQHQLFTVRDGSEVFLQCEDRFGCTWGGIKLGNLPHAPMNAAEAERIATGVADVEDEIIEV
jgi:hypothetical protein